MRDREHPYAPRLKEQSSRKAGSADGGVSVTAACAFLEKFGGTSLMREAGSTCPQVCKCASRLSGEERSRVAG